LQKNWVSDFGGDGSEPKRDRFHPLFWITSEKVKIYDSFALSAYPEGLRWRSLSVLEKHFRRVTAPHL
jgi:hypothetical protein